MLIKIKKNGTLVFNKFQFRCAFGKAGLKINKKEGDKATPKGIFSLGKIYYRSDKIKKVVSNLKCIAIKKNMGWGNNSLDKTYNKELDLRYDKRGEKLFRKDSKYDIFVTINYNKFPIIPNMGSAIFLHLTNNYKPTAGCIAINIKDFLTLLKYIKKKTKIKIG